MAVQHEWDWWSATCIHCGVKREAVEDRIASVNCDIVRQITALRTILPVLAGLVVALVMAWGIVA